MKEIADILNAYQKAQKENKRAALATVVKVEGSSYRRPGARMLITEDGQLTGAISGGCLEGDALRKALSAIHQQENKLVTYDTTDEDDAKLGVQLGCNGIVYILFEPISDASYINPIKLLSELQSERDDAVLVALFSMKGEGHLGTSMLYKKEAVFANISDDIKNQLIEDACNVLDNKASIFENYSVKGQPMTAFLEFIHPPVSLVITGAGNDAQPLAEMAYLLGWDVTIADGRPTHALAQRFPNANRVLVAKPGQLLAQIAIDARTAFVLLTHNYNYDLELLGLLLNKNAGYIGSLGPKTKLIRMLDELKLDVDIYSPRVHGPVGLDIGAETAEEIAISIIAEIKSVFSGASARSLREKKEPIHFYETKDN